MTDDVVETINAILNGEDNFILLLQRPQLERIRDEIVALRAQQEAVRGIARGIAGNERRLSEAIAQQARDEALEEAARTALRWQDTACGEFDKALAIAAAIRLLKEQ